VTIASVDNIFTGKGLRKQVSKVGVSQWQRAFCGKGAMGHCPVKVS